ncbi:MAG: hypothetical protein V7L23_09920 [Nostoc sp.]
MRTDSSPLRSHQAKYQKNSVSNNTKYIPMTLRSHPLNPLQNTPQPR